MAALLQTLSGNPFQTPIGQKVEQATDPSLPSEDWALFLEICDMINDTDEGPKDAARAIKRRLQQSAGKNHTVVMYTLTLLETCVKNCGKRFHTLVTSKDFVSDLVKLIGPRNDPPPALQEKVLNLIQTWSDAFRGQPECSGVVQVYNELKSKKVEFPVPDSDSSAPIHTPQRSVPPYRKSTNDSSSLASTNTSVHPSPHQFHSLHRQASSGQASSMMLSAGPANLSTEQLVKLRGELDVVQGNIKVFHEMMDELIPGKEHPDDWALLRDLNTTCQSMQKRIVELIEKVANEEVTNELLRVNDELNNLFERYERYDRKRTAFINSNPGMVGNLSSTATLPKSLEAQEAGQEPSLIDLNADDVQPNSSLSKGFANLSVGKENPSSKPPAGAGAASDADFDIFAHSRSSISADSKTKASSEAIRTGQVELDLGRNASNTSESDSKPLPLDSERDLVEMEKWLQDQTAGTNPPRHQGSGGDVNFEKFLAERAEAIDKMPK